MGVSKRYIISFAIWFCIIFLASYVLLSWLIRYDAGNVFYVYLVMGVYFVFSVVKLMRRSFSNLPMHVGILYGAVAAVLFHV